MMQVLLFGVCFRQTSIVWLVFVGGAAAVEIIEPTFTKHTKGTQHRSVLIIMFRAAMGLASVNSPPHSIIIIIQMLIQGSCVIMYCVFVSTSFMFPCRRSPDALLPSCHR